MQADENNFDEDCGLERDVDMKDEPEEVPILSAEPVEKVHKLPAEKPKQKRERTEAQKKAWERCLAARAKKREERTKEKAMLEDLEKRALEKARKEMLKSKTAERKETIAKNNEERKEKVEAMQKVARKKVQIVYESESDSESDDSDTEYVVTKRKPVKKAENVNPVKQEAKTNKQDFFNKLFGDD